MDSLSLVVCKQCGRVVKSQALLNHEGTADPRTGEWVAGIFTGVGTAVCGHIGVRVLLSVLRHVIIIRLWQATHIAV